MTADPRTATLHDPRSYVRGVPFDAIEGLRADGPVAWVDEPELPGLPAGSGYHLVLSHSLVTHVLKDPTTFSSSVGGTQIRDPATGEPSFLRSNFQRGVKRLPIRWTASIPSR